MNRIDELKIELIETRDQLKCLELKALSIRQELLELETGFKMGDKVVFNGSVGIIESNDNFYSFSLRKYNKKDGLLSKNLYYIGRGSYKNLKKVGAENE